MKQCCKECGIKKDLSDYYIHPQGRNGVLGRCKECVKKGRRSEEERKMARVLDNKRSSTPKRIEQNTNNTRAWRLANPKKWKAQCVVNNYYRCNKEEKPNQCSHCGFISKKPRDIALHHEDYNKPREVIPLCKLCHKQHHSGIISINLTNTINI